MLKTNIFMSKTVYIGLLGFGRHHFRTLLPFYVVKCTFFESILYRIYDESYFKKVSHIYTKLFHYRRWAGVVNTNVYEESGIFSGQLLHHPEMVYMKIKKSEK